MQKTIDAKEIVPGVVECTHKVEVVCANCGYDLDESELEADTCSDCGTPLRLKQSVTIEATSIPLFSFTA